VRIVTNASTVIRTPTAHITVAQLLDPTPFPGRAQAGFFQGSAQASGLYDTVANELVAKDLFVEPAENVLVGPIRNLTANGAVVNGVPVLLTNDLRIPAEVVQNEFGFAIQPATVAADSISSAEGYFDGANLRAFLISVDDPAATLVNANPQVSITRARVRDRGDNRYDLDIVGAVTMFHAPGATRQRVEIRRVDTNALLGEVQARRAAGTNFGRWSQSFDRLTGTVPAQVRATSQSVGSGTVTVVVDTEP
jgi:hypothetical protein